MDDLERLKELAEKATPGKRVRRDNADYAEVTQDGVMQAMVGTAEDADLLCATDRDVVLKLIARVRELESNHAAIERSCVTVYDYFSDTGTEKQTFHYCRLCGKDRDDVLVSVPITHSDDCPLRSVSPSP